MITERISALDVDLIVLMIVPAWRRSLSDKHGRHIK
jgi:hypothetical protein